MNGTLLNLVKIFPKTEQVPENMNTVYSMGSYSGVVPNECAISITVTQSDICCLNRKSFEGHFGLKMSTLTRFRKMVPIE